MPRIRRKGRSLAAVAAAAAASSALLLGCTLPGTPGRLRIIPIASAQTTDPPPPPYAGAIKEIPLPSDVPYPIINAKSRHLTLDEWSRFLETESSTEFGYDSDPVKARALWDDAIAFEWGRCALEGSPAAMEVRGEVRNCTYVVCHAGKNGVSGYRRKTELFNHVGGDDMASNVAAELIYYTIWNSEDAWCGYGKMSAEVAAGIKCPDRTDCVVTPLMMSMKMMPETIGRLLEAIEELYGSCNLTALIDGSSMRKRRKLERKLQAEAETKLAEEEVERTKQLRRLQDGGNNVFDEQGGGPPPNATDADDADKAGGPSSRPGHSDDIEELPAADFYLSPGTIDQNDMDELVGEDGDASQTDITEAMTEWLLSKTGSASGNNETTSLAVEANYWTSSRAAKMRKEEGDTERAQFWDDVFTLTLKTTVCDETFKNKLLWTGDLKLAPEVSIITAKYIDTNETEMDKWCVVAMVASMATHINVVAVEIRPRIEQHNANAAWMVQSGLENKVQWFDHGLDGTGQVVAVSDTGIDRDNCYFWDAQNPIGPSHRKIVEYKPYVDGADYQYGHGTHVAGTVAGQKAADGLTESGGTADGVAKGAKVAFIDIGDADGYLFLPRTSEVLDTGRRGFTPATRARVHSASWGSVGVNYYSSQAREFDDYMFRNPDFLINVAAGNDGRNNAYNTVSSPATFKNGLAVGCSHGAGYDLARGQLGPSYIADFSSKGPTADGRMTPMVVAPGKYILSAGAQPTQEGECDEGIPGAGSGRGGLKSMAGTSMATPVVSATAALVQQYFREGWYPSGRKNPNDAMENPSAALIKAVLMNGAQTNMNGVDNGGGNVAQVAPYDNVIGFGRINLIKSLYIEGWSDVQAKVWDREVVEDGGLEEYAVTIDMSGGCTFSSLSVTLVWVEKASFVGCSKCVVNDLDLKVIDPNGKTHYPNNKGKRDDTNNAERIVLGGVQDKTTYTFSVEGYNLDDASQSYALVATGCFGGVKNQLDTSQDAFVTDNSSSDRTTTIIIVVCSVVGGILVLCLCGFFIKRRRAKQG